MKQRVTCNVGELGQFCRGTSHAAAADPQLPGDHEFLPATPDARPIRDHLSPEACRARRAVRVGRGLTPRDEGIARLFGQTVPAGNRSHSSRTIESLGRMIWRAVSGAAMIALSNPRLSLGAQVARRTRPSVSSALRFTAFAERDRQPPSAAPGKFSCSRTTATRTRRLITVPRPSGSPTSRCGPRLSRPQDHRDIRLVRPGHDWNRGLAKTRRASSWQGDSTNGSWQAGLGAGNHRQKAHWRQTGIARSTSRRRRRHGSRRKHHSRDRSCRHFARAQRQKTESRSSPSFASGRRMPERVRASASSPA